MILSPSPNSGLCEGLCVSVQEAELVSEAVKNVLEETEKRGLCAADRVTEELSVKVALWL